MKKVLLIILSICIFGFLNVNAKEVAIYFYGENGSTNTSGFKISGDLVKYDKTDCATYNDTATINNINSIRNKTFTLTKNNYVLKNNQEWFALDDNNVRHYFSQNKKYKVFDLIKELKLTSEEYPIISLHANWISKKLDIKENSKLKKLEVYDYVKIEVNNSLDESLSYKSSDSKIARVTSLGRIIGISPGKATITVTTPSGRVGTISVNVVKKSKNLVRIQYNANGGTVASKKYLKTDSNGYIYVDTEIQPDKIAYGSSTSSSGLINYDNTDYVYVSKAGYVAVPRGEWNTKPDGTGKSYSQSKKYKASDFCDASKKDCTVTLYVNWKKKTTNKVHFINLEGQGDSILLESNGKYGLIDTGTKYSKSQVLNYLKSNNINKLEFLILTHNHKDHVEGATYLGDNITINKVYIKHYLANDLSNGKKTKNDKSEMIKIYNDIINKFRGKIVYVDTDSSFKESNNKSKYITLGEMKVYFYNTAQRLQNKSKNSKEYYDYYKESYYGNDENVNSIVNLVKVNNYNILLTGDLDKDAILNGLFQKRIVGKIDRLDLLKIPHHGVFNCIGLVKKDAKPPFSMPIEANKYVVTNTISAKNSSSQDDARHDAISDYYVSFDRASDNTHSKYNSCFYNLVNRDKNKARKMMCNAYYSNDTSDEAIVFDYSTSKVVIKGDGQGINSSKCK